MLRAYPSVCFRLAAFEIKHEIASTEDYQGPLSPSQLWKLTPDAWTIEQGLISAVSRESSQNSAHGGFTILRFSSIPDGQKIFDRVSAEIPSRSDPKIAHLEFYMQVQQVCQIDENANVMPDGALEIGMRELMTEERSLFKALKQKPIRFSALEKSVVIASCAQRLQGTVVKVALGKDITVEDATSQGAWYGSIRGGAAQLYQHLRDLIVSRSPTPLACSPQGRSLTILWTIL